MPVIFFFTGLGKVLSISANTHRCMGKKKNIYIFYIVIDQFDFQLLLLTIPPTILGKKRRNF